MAENGASVQATRLHEALDDAGIEYTYIVDDGYYGERTSWDMDGMRISYMEHHGETAEFDSVVINSSDMRSHVGADYVIGLLGLS